MTTERTDGAVDLRLPPDTDAVDLYRTRDELSATDLLIAALRGFDFFTWLAPRATVTNEQIAAAFGFHTRPVDVMTTLFTAMGLLARESDALRLTSLALEHLVAGSPWFMGAYFPRLDDRPIARDLLTVLRTGQPARFLGRADEGDWHQAMEKESFAAEFTAAMDCRGRITAQALAANIGPLAHTRLLDIAGGSGMFACTLAAHFPQLRGAVLEKPPVDRVATRAIAARGFGDRVQVVARDMLADGLPDGFDLHLYSNVLHDWDEPTVRELLRASARALPAGGAIVVHDAFLNRDKSGPLDIARYSVLLMQISQGRCYGVGEMERLLLDAGFADVRLVPTALGRSALVARRT